MLQPDCQELGAWFGTLFLPSCMVDNAACLSVLCENPVLLPVLGKGTYVTWYLCTVEVLFSVGHFYHSSEMSDIDHHLINTSGALQPQRGWIISSPGVSIETLLWCGCWEGCDVGYMSLDSGMGELFKMLAGVCGVNKWGRNGDTLFCLPFWHCLFMSYLVKYQCDVFHSHTSSYISRDSYKGQKYNRSQSPVIWIFSQLWVWRICKCDIYEEINGNYSIH